MPVDLAHDLWQELKRYISTEDRHEAADTVINLLIDNDYDAEQIRAAFKGDNDIKKALVSFLDDANETDDEDEYLEDEYDEDY